MQKSEQKISLSPFRITVIYLIVAALWIILSDWTLEYLLPNLQSISTFQTFKGLFYVTITALGLYFLVKIYADQIQTKKRELESEQELSSTLFERIPVLITIYDPDFHQFEVNREFEKVIGWSNKEIKEEEVNLIEACYPDHDKREEMIEFMENPGVGWKEFEMTTKSGETITTSWTNIKLTDDTSVGIGIDMTDIKASQAEVRESQKLLKKTFESLEESIIILDPENRIILDCNEHTEKLFGYSYDELLGSSTKKLHVSEEYYQKFNEISLETLQEQGILHTEFKMRRKDGTIFDSSHTVSFVQNEQGNVDKVVSSIRDITAQKEYEQKLQKRRERLQRSQEIGRIGDWELNPETGKISWSPMMFEIYERDPEKGAPSFEEIQSYYKDQIKKHNTAIQKAVDEGKSSDIDLPLQTNRGNQKYIRAIITPVENKSGKIKKLRGIVQDITERKKAELTLNENKERIQNITDNVPGVVFRYIQNPDGTDKLDFVSKGAQEIWGVSQDEAQTNTDSIWKNFPQSDIEHVQKSIQKSAKTLTPWNEEWRYIKPDGTVCWQNGIGIPTKKEDGSIVWDSIILDITERKELEKELSKEKQRFQLVAQTTSDVIWDLDFKKQELWWSKGFEKTFGYTRKSPKDNHQAWKKLIHPDDREKVAQSSQKALESDAKRWTEQYRLIKADGSIAYLVDRAIIIRNKEGEAIRMVGTMDDITERKRAQQKLRESEAKYRHLFEDNPQPMYIYNPNNLQFVEVNRAAIEHYGYSEEEFLDMTTDDIRPQEDVEKIKNAIEKHKSKETYFGEWRHLKKDGTLIEVEVSAANVQYKNETYRLALIHDITEQKRLQEKIIQSVIEGEDRERKRIAHELHDGLGQYLVAASMNLQSVKNDLEKLPEKRQNQFETGLSLLKNALSETRSIAHNLMPKAISDYGLMAALENLIKDFQKSTDIEFQFDHNCDQLHLKNQAKINIYRILQEVISNAVRHSDCSVISVDLQLKKDTLTIKVEDDGIGIEPEEVQQENGLGLRSIKTRVSNLKGTLSIDSEPGEGMQTEITIPNIENLKSNYSDNG